MNYTSERITGTRNTLYTFTERNNKGERLQVELSECYPDNKSKYSLPNLWKKHGYTDRTLANYYSVRTYATDPEGFCRGLYNPQEQTVAGEPRSVIFKGNPQPQKKINFSWMLEVTEQNRDKILQECFRRFMNA